MEAWKTRTGKEWRAASNWSRANLYSNFWCIEIEISVLRTHNSVWLLKYEINVQNDFRWETDLEASLRHSKPKKKKIDLTPSEIDWKSIWDPKIHLEQLYFNFYHAESKFSKFSPLNWFETSLWYLCMQPLSNFIHPSISTHCWGLMRSSLHSKYTF